MGDAADSLLPTGAAFHEGLAESWSAGYQNGSFRRRRECFRSILQRCVEAKQTWLDLGCGTGILTAELLCLGATVVAVDGSPAMLAHARTTVAAQGRVELTLLQSDVQSLPLMDGVFDGIVCSSVIEYVDQPQVVLKEAARVLRPGGKLVLSIPPRNSPVRAAQKLIRWFASWPKRDVFAYLSQSKFELDAPQLSAWCGEAGFLVERVTKFDPFLPGAALAVLHPALLVVEARK